jgi:hypothetical protein
MIIRHTTACPITGNKRTKIWNKTIFKSKLLYDYGFEWIEFRTIGIKRGGGFLASVTKECGDSLGCHLYYVNYLKLKNYYE